MTRRWKIIELVLPVEVEPEAGWQLAENRNGMCRYIKRVPRRRKAA